MTFIFILFNELRGCYVRQAPHRKSRFPVREMTEYLKTEGSLKSETWNETEEAGRRNLNMEHTRPFHFCFQDKTLDNPFIFVKLREREGQRVDLGRSLKGHL